ncbi:hypothetical protein V5O48_017025 [Marasmius crinis-equi]|uniref:Uncharacterized protein n=1 Tax=Marasmius crinis-equi TaxID=585013 RepID=A0ABR3EQ53_9AGAR
MPVEEEQQEIIRRSAKRVVEENQSLHEWNAWEFKNIEWAAPASTLEEGIPIQDRPKDSSNTSKATSPPPPTVDKDTAYTSRKS